MLTRDETYNEAGIVISDLITNQATFTPYDVTTALRKKDLQVEHLYVREYVRNTMFAAVMAGLPYDYEVRQYPTPNGETVDAITFFPVTATPPVQIDDIWSL
jgi:hypothetical protein